MNEDRMRRQQQPGAIDELALQNGIRKRHCKDWPNVILQMGKRIQAVTQTWNKVMWQIVLIPGLSINYSRVGDKLVITVTHTQDDEDGTPIVVNEVHEITVDELGQASKYVEVLIMDKLDHSELIARVDPQRKQADG